MSCTTARVPWCLHACSTFVTLGEGRVRSPAPLSEADGRTVVGLSLLGGEGLHGRVGRSQADERRCHPGCWLCGEHHFLQGRGVLQEADVSLNGAHVILCINAAQRWVLIQRVDFPCDKKSTKARIGECSSALARQKCHRLELLLPIMSPVTVLEEIKQKKKKSSFIK